MIDLALRFVSTELNAHFEATLGRDPEPYVVLSSLSTPAGTPTPGIEQRVILTLVNVEREAALGSGLASRARPDAEGFVQAAAPIALNGFVLISANHTRYDEALRRLSAAVGFIQASGPWDARSSPDFPSDLNRLSVELVNLDFAALNNLWSTLGAKYLPSVLVKIRLVLVDLSRAQARIAAVRGLTPDVRPGDGGSS